MKGPHKYKLVVINEHNLDIFRWDINNPDDIVDCDMHHEILAAIRRDISHEWELGEPNKPVVGDLCNICCGEIPNPNDDMDDGRRAFVDWRTTYD